ncbi:MAG: hypothetical protein IJY55_01035 [Clostridia bacterium]|nr:hypothetical protein [Clostridia bacterium]
MKKIMSCAKLFFYIILLVALLIPLCKLSYKMILDNKSVVNESYIETTIIEMFNTYQENEIVANDTYKNKVCQFVMNLENINDDSSGHPFTYVNVDDCEVVITFGKNQRNILRNKKTGDSIKVRARCKGFEKLFHDIEFNQAIVIE